MKTVKLIELKYEDYENGEDRDTWLFEYSPIGLKKAVDKIYRVINEWYPNRTEEMEWNVDDPYNFTNFRTKNYISYNNSDWLYFYLEEQDVELSSKKENSI